MLNLGARAAQLWFLLKPTAHTTNINPCLVQLQVYHQHSRNLDPAEWPGITVRWLPCLPAKESPKSSCVLFLLSPYSSTR